MWDDLGLPRGTDVPGQSWNPNGISTFLNVLEFTDYRYWDAAYWRTGFIDRQYGKTGYPFVDQISAALRIEGPHSRETRAEALADRSDMDSLWFRCARQWRMRDHMILTFETSRTRSIEQVDLDGKYDLRQRYHSRDPEVALRAQGELAFWAMGREEAVPDIEAVLGRPYYELLHLDFATEGLPRGEVEAHAGIGQSVEAAVDDIISEAVRLMSVLHVRPYLFWTSETELMIAAARPGSARGPWSRRDVERAAPLVAIADGAFVGSDRVCLREWSNARRVAYEPGCDWNVVADDDRRLEEFLQSAPFLGPLLDSDSWTDDDRELVRRLVRLGRFGYGLPQVCKPEYRNVHVLPCPGSPA